MHSPTLALTTQTWTPGLRPLNPFRPRKRYGIGHLRSEVRVQASQTEPDGSAAQAATNRGDDPASKPSSVKAVIIGLLIVADDLSSAAPTKRAVPDPQYALPSRQQHHPADPRPRDLRSRRRGARDDPLLGASPVVARGQGLDSGRLETARGHQSRRGDRDRRHTPRLTISTRGGGCVLDMATARDAAPAWFTGSEWSRASPLATVVTAVTVRPRPGNITTGTTRVSRKPAISCVSAFETDFPSSPPTRPAS